jgi:hypothetical protein
MLGWTKGKPCWDQTPTLAGSSQETIYHLVQRTTLSLKEMPNSHLAKWVQSWATYIPNYP